MSVTSYTLDPNDVLMTVEGAKSKDAVVKSGEGSLARGQLLAREISSDKLRVLKDVAGVTVEASGITFDGSKVNFVAETDNKPLVPGTLKVTLSTSEVFEDNGQGVLSSSVGFGSIDYNNGKFGLAFNTAPANTVTAAVDYSHFGNAGALDVSDAGILVSAVDATSADKKATVYSAGDIDPAKLTPVIDIAVVKLNLMFQKLGFNLKKRY